MGKFIIGVDDFDDDDEGFPPLLPLPLILFISPPPSLLLSIGDGLLGGGGEAILLSPLSSPCWGGEEVTVDFSPPSLLLPVRL